MSSSFFTLLSISVFTVNFNKSPFFMNLAMILLIFVLASWSMWANNKWLFSILIIFYLGGMMILFGYIISVSKSKYVFFSFPPIIWLSTPFLLLSAPELLTKPAIFFFLTYSFMNSQIIFFLASTLLLLLFITNKICLTNYGPLASKNDEK